MEEVLLLPLWILVTVIALPWSWVFFIGLLLSIPASIVVHRRKALAAIYYASLVVSIISLVVMVLQFAPRPRPSDTIGKLLEALGVWALIFSPVLVGWVVGWPLGRLAQMGLRNTAIEPGR